jgi:Mg-chelatase subunit ChlD
VVFTWPQSIAKVVRSCEIPTDVVLGIDLSGSMNNDGGAPPQPVTAALEAAGQFVGTLRAKDQVAVTTFATHAQLTDTLTNNREALADKITSLKIQPAEERGFTNTVEALQMALGELDSERHNPDARRVLVLLTDGLPTAAGNADVVEQAIKQAQVLREQNIDVYTIGLGENVDRAFIQSVASDNKKAYFAPTGSDLAAIYKEITSSLCEVGPTKIDVYAKTKTNFAVIE